MQLSVQAGRWDWMDGMRRSMALLLNASCIHSSYPMVALRGIAVCSEMGEFAKRILCACVPAACAPYCGARKFCSYGF